MKPPASLTSGRTYGHARRQARLIVRSNYAGLLAPSVGSSRDRVGVCPTRLDCGCDGHSETSRCRRRTRSVTSDAPNTRASRDDRYFAHISIHSGRNDGGGDAIAVTTGNQSSRRGFNSVMMPISFSPLRAHDVHADATSGGGRAMACRPIGLCPPERLERGWSANRGARLTRVSAKRLQCAGGAVDLRGTRMSVPATTSPRGMGGRERSLTA